MNKFVLLVGMMFMLLSCDLDFLNENDGCTGLIGTWCFHPLLDRSSCFERITFNSDGTLESPFFLSLADKYSSDCSKIDFYSTAFGRTDLRKFDTWIIISLTPDELVLQTDEFDNNSRKTYWRWR